MKRIHSTLAMVAVGMLHGLAQASEGGGSNYPAGVENFSVGAVPPPGVYALVYGEVFSADKLKDNSGNQVPVPGFSVKADVIAPRFIWSTAYPVLGGNLAFHTILPLVNLKVSAAGASQSKTGLGDITIGPAIAWHHSPHLHSALGLDFVAPSGGYDKTDLANIGHNHWSLQPLYTVSYIDPTGFNADFKATLNLNQRNKATDYKSGTEFWLDYAVGWGFGNGWTAGLGGYYTTQLADDRQAGVVVANNKARGLSIGPSIRYDNGKGWFFTAKVQRDLGSRNRTEGSALWLKTTIPF